MNTNKEYKRVPFTIGLAKKIQSGEVEGRIVTSEDLLVRIVDFNFKDKTDSIVYIGTYANGEQEFIQTCDNEGKSFGADVLFIELPEKAPKQKGELTLGKCKEGDEVWIYSNYEYGPEYVKVKVGKFSLDISSGHRRNVTFDDGFTCQELTSQICWYENPEEQKTKTKEFKVGDKVKIYPDKTNSNHSFAVIDRRGSIGYITSKGACGFAVKVIGLEDEIVLMPSELQLLEETPEKEEFHGIDGADFVSYERRKSKEQKLKNKFKAGDPVKIISGEFEGTYGTIYQDVESIYAIVNIYGYGHRSVPVRNIVLFNNVGRVIKEEPKYMFKPFDKVLVRASEFDKWKANFFFTYGRRVL